MFSGRLRVSADVKVSWSSNKRPPQRPPRPRRALRLGVTGHRPDGKRAMAHHAVKKTLRRVFAEVDALVSGVDDRAYDRSEKPDVVLISALAEGPDQWAVSVFDERPKDHGGRPVVRRLEYVLPFAPGDYAKTMQDPDAKTFMAERVAAAEIATILADWSPGPSPGPVDAFRRDRRFATVGDVIVRQADLLIAVWDGLPSHGVGGPADVVALALAQAVPVVWIEPDSGKVCLVRLPTSVESEESDETEESSRSDEGEEPGDAEAPAFQGPPPGDFIWQCQNFACDCTLDSLREALGPVLIPPSPRPKDLKAARGLRNRLFALFSVAQGRSPRTLSAYLDAEVVRSKTRHVLYQMLLPSFPWAGFPLRTDFVRTLILDPEKRKTFRAACQAEWYVRLRERLAPAWAAADSIGTHLGHIYRSYYVLVFILAGLAVFTGVSGAFAETLAPSSEVWFVAAELLMLIAALSLHRRGIVTQHHLRWLQARELSEQARAHWALGLMGLGGRRVLSGKVWTAWLFNAHAAEAGLPNVRLDRLNLAAVAREIDTVIVNDQIDYHRSNDKHLRRVHRRLEDFGRFSLNMGFGVSVLLILALIFEARIVDQLNAWGFDGYRVFDSLRLLLISAAAFLPAFAAAATGMRFQGDFQRFADRSRETAKALVGVQRQLRLIAGNLEQDQEADDRPLFESLRSVVTDLERVLLSDLDDWRFVYRARQDVEPA